MVIFVKRSQLQTAVFDRTGHSIGFTEDSANGNMVAYTAKGKPSAAIALLHGCDWPGFSAALRIYIPRGQMGIACAVERQGIR